MKNTGIKVEEVSIETMLNDKENAAYNPSVWREKITRYSKYENIKFYVAKKDNVYRYDRFFVSYTIPEGLNFLSEWDAFSSSLTNRGFVRAYIINGEIVTAGFGENGDNSIVNTKKGRKWLKDNICNNGVLITNSL